GLALEDHRELVAARAPDGELVRRLLVHRPLRLGRDRPRAAGVEVDPRARRRHQRTDGGDLLRVGHEGGYHGPIIRAAPRTPPPSPPWRPPWPVPRARSSSRPPSGWPRT